MVIEKSCQLLLIRSRLDSRRQVWTSDAPQRASGWDPNPALGPQESPFSFRELPEERPPLGTPLRSHLQVTAQQRDADTLETLFG